MNLVNSKVYIGQSVNIYKRWRQHISAHKTGKSIIYQAMRKYGVNNFKLYILRELPREKLDEFEVCYINYFQSSEREYGYNILLGGQGKRSAGENRNYKTKLSVEDVRNIRISYGNIENKSDVYKKYKNKISFGGFSDIWNGKTWSHVCMDVYTQENKEAHKNKNYKKAAENARIFSSKISDEEILLIRNKKNEGKLSKKEVYELFPHINKSAYDKIWNGTTFKNIISNTENHYKKFSHGSGVNCGEKSACSKLTKEQVRKLKCLKENGFNATYVYENYGYKDFISYSGFYAIWSGRNWKNVQCNEVS